MEMRLKRYLQKEIKHTEKENGQHQNQNLNWNKVQVMPLWREYEGHGSKINLLKMSLKHFCYI